MSSVSSNKKRSFRLTPETPFSMGGVNDGTRTHDRLDHNQVLPPTELHSPHNNFIIIIIVLPFIPVG